MCGRYLITSAPEAFRRLFGYPEQPNFPPRYNVAPTQPIPIVRVMEGRRQFALVRWGLIPPWTEDPRKFSLLVNARAESVNARPAFRNAMRRRRCLVPADGFFEWKADGAGKRPYCVRPRDGSPIAFAGLWESWIGPNGEEMESAAIVTTVANSELAALHGRMPVIVPREAFELWLDCGNVDATLAAVVLVPARAGLLEAYEVSPEVNHVANDSVRLIERAPAPSARGVAGAAAPAAKRRETKKDARQGSLF